MNKVIKHFCPNCKQNKSVFDTDWFNRKICPECGNVLENRVYKI